MNIVYLDKKRKGFALAAVLWLLAGLTILAAMISRSTYVVAERQASLLARANAEQNFLSDSSEAIFWLATSKATESGYGWPGTYLKLDDRAYSGAGNSIIQVQDVRGLLSLNRPKRDLLRQLLISCGAKDTETDSLLDALEDYAEPGNLKRINGAKSFEYAQAGMPQQRGAPLLSEPEIWRVYGWAKYKETFTTQHCLDDMTVWGDGLFNPGTATERNLIAYGVSAEQIAAVRKERGSNDDILITTIQKGKESGNNLFGLTGGRFPSKTMRITLSSPDIHWVLRYELRLHTDAAGSPWDIISPRRLPANSVITSKGRTSWPKIDQLSETDKNAISQPALPF